MQLPINFNSFLDKVGGGNRGLSGGAVSSSVNCSTLFNVKVTMHWRSLHEHNQNFIPVHNDSVYTKLPPYLVLKLTNHTHVGNVIDAPKIMVTGDVYSLVFIQYCSLRVRIASVFHLGQKCKHMADTIRLNHVTPVHPVTHIHMCIQIE